MYAGDSVIGLIYAENASLGHYFEFNYGEKSAGITTPGFMLLTALLFNIFQSNHVPLFVIIINYLAWYGLLYFFYLLLKITNIKDPMFMICLLVVGLMPGSVYNAVLGMENGTFGFIIIFWTWLALTWGYFDKYLNKNRLNMNRQVILGTTLGIAVWIRPEAIPFLFLVIGFNYLLTFKVGFKCYLKNNIYLMLSFIIPLFLLIYFHYDQTELLIPSSGKSRMMMGSQLDIFGVPVNYKFALRLIYYFPLTFFWGIGVIILIRQSYKRLELSVELFFVLVFISFFVLYSTILGAHHLSRYVIFIIPFLVIIASIGGNWLWDNWGETVPVSLKKFRNLFFSFMALSIIGIYSIETVIRLNMANRDGLYDAMNAQSHRIERSNLYIKLLGSPTKHPIVIGYDEVQNRYHLDDRFIVRSLDGRVDEQLLQFVNDGHYDHIGYIKHRNIQYLGEFPNHNSDTTLWSLENLKALDHGESVEREGLLFTKLPDSHFVKIERIEK